MPIYSYEHGVSRSGGLQARQTSKLQNKKALFHVELLYLTVHKSFLSTL